MTKEQFAHAFVAAIDKQGLHAPHTPGWKTLLELVWEELNERNLLASDERADVPRDEKPAPVAYRWKWDKHLEWHYGEYLSQRDYYASEPLYNVAPMAWVPMGIAHPEGDGDVLTISTTGMCHVVPAPQVRALWRQREPGEDCYYRAWMPLPSTSEEAKC